MAVIGFTGSEELKNNYIKVITKIVKEVENRGDTIAVGDSEIGVDAIVTGSAEKLYSLFYLFDDINGKEAEADRSTRLIEASDELIIVADKSCPPDCYPSDKFIGYSSIKIWGSAAYALGIGKKIIIIWCSKGMALLPEWQGGYWEQIKTFGTKGYRFIESGEKSEQMKLF
jgi:hypothetical protein